MMMTKKVKLRYAWQHYPKGYIFTAMSAAQAQLMVAVGQAEYLTEDINPAPVNRMMAVEKPIAKNKRKP